MLLKERYRGWVNQEDKGVNKDYYLFVNVWYFTFSPHQYWSSSHVHMFSTESDGHSGGYPVDDIGGVLIYLHGLCFRFK